MTYWIIVIMMLVAIIAVVLALGTERDSGHPDMPEPIDTEKERTTDADA